uniref:Major facilitator superfamily (MFS) profile domain-containing protein n=1 Tax=Globisporangium ultimum (strain ATCC 200006 / CBS 805.95 / DAOM BR144) TaxID=431595 RepID=K3WX93_GLOUD
MAMPTAEAAMAMDAPLAHIRHRLDALVYDDHSQYLVGSLQHTDALFMMSSHSIPGLTQVRQPPGSIPSARNHPSRMSSAGLTIRRRRIPGDGRWARTVGLTPYYVVFVLFIGLGWLFQAIGVFNFAFAYPTMLNGPSQIERITDPQKSYLVLSMFFLAEMVGAIGFGMCADHYGRQRVLLACIGTWFVGQGLITLAWNYASLLTFRLIAGIGFGGQSALLITISLEFSPKRTRGRVLVLSQLLGVCGAVIAALCAKSATERWRWPFLVLTIISVFFALLYMFNLRESPKYLASIGRLEQALQVLQGMESAHGIDRQARVTMPSSLYAPPAIQQRRRNSSRTSSRIISDVRPLGSPSQVAYQLKEDEEMDSDDIAPLPLPATRRGTGNNDNSSYAVSTSGNVGRPRASTDRHAAASPAMVSFSVSSSRRFAVLFQSHYLRKTLFLWGVWLLLSGCFGVALTCMMRQVEKRNASVGDYVCWGVMAFPGLILGAVLVEQIGRKLALAVMLFLSAVMMFVVGAFLSEDATWASILLPLGCLLFFVAGAFGALCVYTGEQYALMVRVMGISWALALGHLGSFIGVYVALNEFGVRRYHGRQVMMWISGGLCFVVMFIVLAFGYETKGQDIDVIEPAKPERISKREPQPGGDNFEYDSEGLPHDGSQEHHVPHELSTVPSSPGASFSSSSSSSADSTVFFQKRAKKNWAKQMRALASAAASAVPLRKSQTAALRKKSTRSTLHSDSVGDLDQLDMIVMGAETKSAQYLRHESEKKRGPILEYSQRRKQTDRSDASEPALMDLRASDDHSSDEDIESGRRRSDSEADRFSIQMYDSFSSMTTPVLGDSDSPELRFQRLEKPRDAVPPSMKQFTTTATQYLRMTWSNTDVVQVTYTEPTLTRGVASFFGTEQVQVIDIREASFPMALEAATQSTFQMLFMVRNPPQVIAATDFNKTTLAAVLVNTLLAATTKSSSNGSQQAVSTDSTTTTLTSFIDTSVQFELLPAADAQLLGPSPALVTLDAPSGAQSFMVLHVFFRNILSPAHLMQGMIYQTRQAVTRFLNLTSISRIYAAGPPEVSSYSVLQVVQRYYLILQQNVTLETRETLANLLLYGDPSRLVDDYESNDGFFATQRPSMFLDYILPGAAVSSAIATASSSSADTALKIARMDALFSYMFSSLTIDQFPPGNPPAPAPVTPSTFIPAISTEMLASRMRKSQRFLYNVTAFSNSASLLPENVTFPSAAKYGVREPSGMEPVPSISFFAQSGPSVTPVAPVILPGNTTTPIWTLGALSGLPNRLEFALNLHNVDDNATALKVEITTDIRSSMEATSTITSIARDTSSSTAPVYETKSNIVVNYQSRFRNANEIFLFLEIKNSTVTQKDTSQPCAHCQNLYERCGSQNKCAALASCVFAQGIENAQIPSNLLKSGNLQDVHELWPYFQNCMTEAVELNVVMLLASAVRCQMQRLCAFRTSSYYGGSDDDNKILIWEGLEGKHQVQTSPANTHFPRDTPVNISMRIGPQVLCYLPIFSNTTADSLQTTITRKCKLAKYLGHDFYLEVLSKSAKNESDLTTIAV